MTVEELNIKITADAENFKRAVSEANSAMESFRRRAVSAGEEVSSAMSGLLGVGVTGTISEYSGQAAPALTDYSGRIGAAQAFSASVGTIPLPSTDGFIDSLARGNAASGAAGGASEVQPLNITTEIVIDGDKLGEAVSRYNVKRNRITNGIEA